MIQNDDKSIWNLFIFSFKMIEPHFDWMCQYCPNFLVGMIFRISGLSRKSAAKWALKLYPNYWVNLRHSSPDKFTGSYRKLRKCQCGQYPWAFYCQSEFFVQITNFSIFILLPMKMTLRQTYNSEIFPFYSIKTSLIQYNPHSLFEQDRHYIVTKLNIGSTVLVES